ncbi:MAG: hypothetical protein ACREVH_02115, partial [Gammaproteobacteria bacterium]
MPYAIFQLLSANIYATGRLTRLHEALFAASRHLNELDKDRNPLLPPDLCPKKDLYKIRTF